MDVGPTDWTKIKNQIPQIHEKDLQEILPLLEEFLQKTELTEENRFKIAGLKHHLAIGI